MQSEREAHPGSKACILAFHTSKNSFSFSPLILPYLLYSQFRRTPAWTGQPTDVRVVWSLLSPWHTALSRSELLPFATSSLLCPWVALNTLGFGSQPLPFSVPLCQSHLWSHVFLLKKKIKLLCTHHKIKSSYCKNQRLFPTYLSCHFPEVCFVIFSHSFFSRSAIYLHISLSLCSATPHTSKLCWHDSSVM